MLDIMGTRPVLGDGMLWFSCSRALNLRLETVLMYLCRDETGSFSRLD